MELFPQFLLGVFNLVILPPPAEGLLFPTRTETPPPPPSCTAAAQAIDGQQKSFWAGHKTQRPQTGRDRPLGAVTILAVEVYKQIVLALFP